MSTVTVVKLC